MEPRDVRYDPDKTLPAPLFTFNHNSLGTHVLYADGNTEYLDEEVSHAELRSLIERSDGDNHVR